MFSSAPGDMCSASSPYNFLDFSKSQREIDYSSASSRSEQVVADAGTYRSGKRRRRSIHGEGMVSPGVPRRDCMCVYALVLKAVQYALSNGECE